MIIRFFLLYASLEYVPWDVSSGILVKKQRVHRVARACTEMSRYKRSGRLATFACLVHWSRLEVLPMRFPLFCVLCLTLWIAPISSSQTATALLEPNVGSSQPRQAGPARRELILTHRYLHLPVRTGAPSDV